MPLRDLVEYFNQRISAEQGLTQPPLVVRDGRVEGKFAGLRLATAFHPLRRADDRVTVVGHAAALRVRPEDGGAALAAELFEQTDAGQVVGLDRLCRTIHMLNYLPGAHEGGYLFLAVHPRHVLGVKANHGAYFEEVIFRCGLEAERVVIALALTAAYQDQLPRLLEGLANYRRRGYATALGLDQPDTAALARCYDELKSRFVPDFLRFPAAPEASSGRDSAAGAGSLRRLGTRLLVEGIVHEHQLESAHALGAEWVAGELIETLARGERRSA